MSAKKENGDASSAPSAALVTRRVSKRGASAADKEQTAPLMHIMSGRPRDSAIAFVGPESEMPDASQFTVCKRFSFTMEEQLDMTSNGTRWTDTKTFTQATKWAYSTSSSDLPLGSPSALAPKVSASTQQTPKDKTQFQKFMKTLQRYKDEIKPSKPKAVDIYLMYGYGSNESPPRGGRPLLFDVWESDVPENGAKFYAERHGATEVMKFRALDGRTATEWVEFFISGSNAYHTRHGDTRPQWHDEPRKYRQKELKFDIFDLAATPEELGTGARTDTDPTFLSTVQAAVRQLLVDDIPKEEEEETRDLIKDLEADAVDQSPAPAPGDMEDTLGGGVPDKAVDEIAVLKPDGEGQTQPYKQEEAQVESGGGSGKEEDTGGPASSTVIVDTFARQRLCMVCCDVVDVEQGEVFILCNGAFQGDHKKHWCHSFCFPPTQATTVPCKGLYKEAKAAQQLTDAQVPPAFLDSLTCAFSTMKNTMKQASAADAKVKQDRADELEHARAKMALSATKEATAPPKLPAEKERTPELEVELEVIAITLRGLPLNPSWTKREKEDKLDKFRSIWKTAGIETSAAWMSAPSKGGMVNLSVVLGPCRTQDGELNMNTIQMAARLLASQALEAPDHPSTIWTHQSGAEMYAQGGWMRAGYEAIFQVDDDSFDTRRITIQLERSQDCLQHAPSGLTADQKTLKYVLAEACPVQAYIRGPMPRYLSKMFNVDFDEEEANRVRAAQRARERKQREQEKREAPKAVEARRPVNATPLKRAREDERQQPSPRTGGGGGGSGSGWSTPTTGQRGGGHPTQRQTVGGSGSGERRRHAPSPAVSTSGQKEEADDTSYFALGGYRYL